LRVQSKIATQNELAANAEAAAAGPEATPTEPKVELGARAQPADVTVNQEAIEKATRELRARVESLETELEKSKKQAATAQKEKTEIAGKLQQTNTELEQAKTELAKT